MISSKAGEIKMYWTGLTGLKKNNNTLFRQRRQNILSILLILSKKIQKQNSFLTFQLL